jgi:type I restriction enzyme M protein
MQLLKEGGRIAIVLPDGILAGEKIGYISHYIEQVSRVIALIDLPIETFAPMVTTKTHLVILEKKQSGQDYRNYPIFMAVAEKVGHDRKGRSLFRGDKTIYDDIPQIIENFRNLDPKSKKQFSHLGYFVESKWLEQSLIARRYLPQFMEALSRLEKMPYPKLSLGEIKNRLNSGANVANTDYTDEKTGIPYILVKNITYEGISCAELKYVTAQSVRKAKNAVVRAGEILINRTGNSGIAAIVPDDLDGAIACGFVFRLSVKKDYDTYYVAAFLNSELGQKQTQRLAAGSILEHITKPDLETVRIPFPSKDVQREISEGIRKATLKRVESRQHLHDVLKALAGALDS